MSDRNILIRENANTVRNDLLLVLKMLRQLGYSTMGGLERIAKHCKVPSRRTRTIAFEDQTYTATDDQRRYMAFALADLADQLAEECEARARAYRYEADGIRSRERQQQCVPLGSGIWAHSTRSAGRLAA